MTERDWERVSDSTMTALDALERHAYLKLTELIDAGEIDTAEQLASVLEGLGIV